MDSKTQCKRANGHVSPKASRVQLDQGGKAWTERVILGQSVFWMSIVGLVMVTSLIQRLNETDLLVLSVSLAAPPILLPILSPSRPDKDLPWARCYWFKLNVWVAIIVGFGTYFGTHYFFDLMGMRYTFNVQWTFDSHVLGQSGQRVPVFMYPLTHAYFMSYYTALMVAERKLGRFFQAGPFLRIFIVFGLSYVLAFAETFFMDNHFMAGLFAYDKHDRMLVVGSFGYASYFVVGLPMVRRIDEGEQWTMGRVVIEALATCMGILVLLEVWAKMIGAL
ncbi:hypothetical protein jhhlp_006640 [Lomentospora prolificans]|uniref:Cycloeucalenol cycloisomerase n=1 Tax=Lomentospora prolificans TaxID=41688 RepID=A0A2N3N6H1_9PEZI|nr:hypothetical protein jhhlp_006640 [Lomentospora prolificans]